MTTWAAGAVGLMAGALLASAGFCVWLIRNWPGSTGWQAGWRAGAQEGARRAQRSECTTACAEGHTYEHGCVLNVLRASTRLRPPGTGPDQQ